ncbi:MAG: PAS domain S-box protein [Phycisphaerales bacterium]|nr:PAS domain S-box protein [Phycisphaerales bacterium]
MNNGRSTMMLWIAATLGGAAAISFAMPMIRTALAGMPPAAASAAEFLAIAAFCIASGVMLIKATARQVRTIAPRLMPEAVDGAAPTIRGDIVSGPIVRQVNTLASAWAESRNALQAQVQEVLIRHRVSEAEREHVEAILHSLRDAVIVTDGFDELSMANGQAADLLGFDLAKAQHASVDAILRDDTLRQLIKEVRSSAVAGKERRVEHIFQDNQGRAHSFDVTVACLPDSGTESGGVVTIMRDVTRDKEISQMKNDFVSQASHELRTPLASIRAYVEMLTEGEATDEESRQEFYSIIRTETDRVARMVDNMLNISRIEAGIVKAEYTDVNFAEVSREVVDMLTLQAQEKSIKLAVKCGPLVYNAAADRDMMTQVVMNLVSNGIKYTPDGGRVTVTIDNDDATRSVMVTVADTGLGVPPDALDKIFDKFFRIENYKRVAKGTGLGLNLVRHIVETVHSGKIGVTSEVGMGSKFWFTIPYEQDDSIA